MSALKELLGPKLLKNKNETIDTDTAFEGKKAVGIYFSAHWCPPCRMFTPQLGSAYTKDLKEKGLEIVFVSSDRDQGAFDEYFGEQPWLAVPFEERDIKKKLSKKYKVSGIPSFVIVDTDGKTITTDGRSKFSEDPEGNDLPWIPPTLNEIMADATFIDKEGKEMKWDDYRGKPVGLYFSAHWCGPCRGFTPELIKTYESVREGEKGKDFEIIFISSDQDEKSFKEYYGEMPWNALKYDQRKIKSNISDHFQVQGIPTFVMMDENGKVINADARGAVGADPKGDDFPWAPKAVGDLQSPDGINDTPSLCLMVDGDSLTDDARESAISTFKSVVEPIYEANKNADKDQSYCFFVAKTSGGIVDRVRQLCKLGESKGASVVMVDVPEEGSYTMEAEEITVDSIKSFIADYEAGKLKKVGFE